MELLLKDMLRMLTSMPTTMALLLKVSLMEMISSLMERVLLLKDMHLLFRFMLKVKVLLQWAKRIRQISKQVLLTLFSLDQGLTLQ
jgi:hypothetical protein